MSAMASTRFKTRGRGLQRSGAKRLGTQPGVSLKPHGAARQREVVADFQVWAVAQAPQGETPDLDAETLWCDVLTSSFTEQDRDFEKEWTAIQADRVATGWQENFDEAKDLAYRFRELRAMTRSACRRGILTRLESPTIAT